MKSTFFSILFLIALICEGQQNTSSSLEFDLLNPSNLWSVLDDFEYVHVHPDDPYSYTKSTWYKIGADTTIADVGYKKLMQATDPNHENWQLEGHFLRQEGDQIYSKDGANQETLLYDFGMDIGDSIETEIYPRTNYISILDSIGDTTLNNTTRKIYYLREFPKPDPDWKAQEIWIEGIGSTTDGLLRQTEFGLTPANHGYQLICFHQDETLIYQSQDFDNCYIDIVDGLSENKIPQGDFKIFPNPTAGRLTIEIDQTVLLPAKIEILSIAGKIIKIEKVSQVGQLTVDLTGISQGVYLIGLTSDNQKAVRKFIVK